MRQISGFTLIEALVAMVVLTTALIPALLLAGSSVDTATRIKNNFVAANLAQEGVEVVRVLRDNNWFNDTATPFDQGLDAGTYEVAWDSNAVQASLDRFLKYDSTNGLYNYTAGADSIFKRTITVTVVSANELRVDSEVRWQEKGGIRSVKVESHLYDWY